MTPMIIIKLLSTCKRKYKRAIPKTIDVCAHDHDMLAIWQPSAYFVLLGGHLMPALERKVHAACANTFTLI